MSARPPSATPRPVALVGLRCSGKTTVGRSLAELVEVPFVDLDEQVAAAAGVPQVATLIERDGIESFRRRELESLRAAFRRLDGPFVLSTGGGAVETEAVRRALAEKTFGVWLRAPLARLRERLAGDATTSRPALVGGPALVEGDDEFAVLSRRRGPWYAEAAALVLDVEDLAPREIASRIARRWRAGE